MWRQNSTAVKKRYVVTSHNAEDCADIQETSADETGINSLKKFNGKSQSDQLALVLKGIISSSERPQNEIPKTKRPALVVSECGPVPVVDALSVVANGRSSGQVPLVVRVRVTDVVAAITVHVQRSVIFYG